MTKPKKKPVFLCNKCNETHERPINSKCTMTQQSQQSEQNPTVQESTNELILHELQSLSNRMTAMEHKVNNPVVSTPVSTASSASRRSSRQTDELVLPTIATLNSSRSVQRQVDDRLKELQSINESGKFKSNRGGLETVFVKKEVPWPQSYILGGSNKGRVSYDALSMSQWVAGFAQIIREESDQNTRDNMLDYLSDLMEDSHDFGWQAAKGSHAVLLCKMEEAKITWDDTHKIDRVRRVHAQRAPHQSHRKVENKDRSLPCRFYQKGSCSHRGDHETGGTLYLHICNLCHAKGKHHPHPSKDCRNKSKNE